MTAIATKTAKTLSANGANGVRDLVGELDNVLKLRERWEAGSYKSSNDELYAILGRCLDIFVQLKGRETHQIIQRRLLNERLTAAGITYKDSTTLATKVVRYVFNSDRKRAHTYARTVMSAHEHGIDSVRLASWIRAEGGIEQVKRKSTSKVSPKDLATLRRERAERHFYGSQALATFKSVNQLKPSADGVSRLSYALIRTEDDGTASVVYGASNATMIKLLLARAGQEVIAQEELEAHNADAMARKAARAKAVSKAA